MSIFIVTLLVEHNDNIVVKDIVRQHDNKSLYDKGNLQNVPDTRKKNGFTRNINKYGLNPFTRNPFTQNNKIIGNNQTTKRNMKDYPSYK